MQSTCTTLAARLVVPQVMGNNSVVPAHHEVSLHAVEDNQPVACVDIYEGCCTQSGYLFGALAGCVCLFILGGRRTVACVNK